MYVCMCDVCLCMLRYVSVLCRGFLKCFVCPSTFRAWVRACVCVVFVLWVCALCRSCVMCVLHASCEPRALRAFFRVLNVMCVWFHCVCVCVCVLCVCVCFVCVCVCL